MQRTPAKIALTQWGTDEIRIAIMSALYPQGLGLRGSAVPNLKSAFQEILARRHQVMADLLRGRAVHPAVEYLAGVDTILVWRRRWDDTFSATMHTPPHYALDATTGEVKVLLSADQEAALTARIMGGL